LRAPVARQCALCVGRIDIAAFFVSDRDVFIGNAVGAALERSCPCSGGVAADAATGDPVAEVALRRLR
jgi:hypothetical protein